MKNILIFPCGADNAIELYDSLRYSPRFDVFGATSQDDRGDLIYPPAVSFALHLRRISATMGLFRMRGVNLPLLFAYDALDEDLRIIRQDFAIESERIPRNVYRIGLRYSRIYVDYDDTLVVRGA